jgi:ATP-binding cassette, subfamily C, bacterial
MKTPVVTSPLLQMEATECGAASLGIILGYYNRIVPLAELRRACNISRNGVNALNLVKAARNYGLNAKAYKKSLEDIKNVRPPYIVFWNFNHFLVVEGFDENQVYLNDPASGRRSVSWSEFSRAFTGVVLEMKPGENFQTGGEKTNTTFSLGQRLKHSWGTIAFCLLAGFFLTLPRLAVPAFAQVFVDEILVSERKDWLRPLILGMVLTSGMTALLASLQLKYLRRLMLKLSVTMSGQFLWHILRLPVGFYAQRYAGEISSRLQLNDKVATILSGRLATTLIDGAMMIFYLLIMLQYDWLMTLIVVAFAAVNFMVLKLFSLMRVVANMKLAQEYGKVMGVAIFGIQSIETVKASGLESDLFARFAGYYAKAANAQQQLGLQTQLLTILPTLLSSLSTAAILIAGGYKVMNGTLSIGMLVAYQSITSSFLQPVNTLLNFGSTLQDLQADLNRLDDVLQNPVDVEVRKEMGRQGGQGRQSLSSPKITEVVAPTITEEKSNFLDISSQGKEFWIGSLQDLSHPLSFKLQGYLELKGITFGYSRVEKSLIENLSFTLKPGQRVAIIGSSGSGKSTVVKLLCGLYEPWEGEIYFDGVSRKEISRAVLANSIAMVEQDIFLFAGTVRDNLTLWDSTIPETDLIKACQDAAIHDLIMSLPGGYDAKLIEGGMNLSGGQRQRLEIARALVRNPAVLVLDEATSALDAETEMIIDKNLRRRGCACAVVAHRLSTIRDCEEIIMLEGGKVVQRGSHEDLWSLGGKYAQLIKTSS